MHDKRKADPTEVVGKVTFSSTSESEMPLFDVVRTKKFTLCLVPSEGDPNDPFVIVRLLPRDTPQSILERLHLLTA